ncbi:hypothetical protein KP509_37G009200 [Ceratopteris richardii]|uniref:Uncharacterized protein n=1 Tax=Ceratopteris richardii TaxID=49495 RepID=A0A8T2Q5B0_CERRI|nr:hypothetical protein KP509_37G009200 [Ceratopteris richardii]
MTRLHGSASPSWNGCLMVDPIGLLLLEQEAPCIPQKLLRRMMKSQVWQRYERGFISSLDEAANELSRFPYVQRWYQASLGNMKTSLPETLSKTLRLSRSQLTIEPAMAEFLESLCTGVCAKLACVSNLNAEELSFLRCAFPSLFDKFDAIAISGEERVGKDSWKLLRTAMERVGVSDPRQCAYITVAKDMEAVLAARSLGLYAIVLHESSSTSLGKIPFRHLQFDHVLSHILGEIHLQPQHHLQQCRSQIIPDSRSLHVLNPEIAQYRNGLYVWIPSMARSMPKITCLPHSVDVPSCSSHIHSARRFLFREGKECQDFMFYSFTSEGIRIFDNFAQFLIAEAMKDARFLPMNSPPPTGLFCFVGDGYTGLSPQFMKDTVFQTGSDASTYLDIPADLDTTSVGLSVMHAFSKVDMETINLVLDSTLQYLSMDDGIVQVYFDKERPRVDPVVVANVLYLFHLAGRQHDIESSARYVHQVLLHGAYENGTIFYALPECFLFHVSRLVHRFPDHFADNGIRDLLQHRLGQHISNLIGDLANNNLAISLAMSIVACYLCGLNGAQYDLVQTKVLCRLLELQREDGSWNCDPYYRYGSNSVSWIGNEGVTTAFALLAINLHSGSSDWNAKLV